PAVRPLEKACVREPYDLHRLAPFLRALTREPLARPAPALLAEPHPDVATRECEQRRRRAGIREPHGGAGSTERFVVRMGIDESTVPRRLTLTCARGPLNRTRSPDREDV